MHICTYCQKDCFGPWIVFFVGTDLQEKSQKKRRSKQTNSGSLRRWIKSVILLFFGVHRFFWGDGSSRKNPKKIKTFSGNIKRTPKDTLKYQKTNKRCQKIPEDTERYQKIPKDTKRYRKIPKDTKRYSKNGQKDTKRYRKIP